MTSLHSHPNLAPLKASMPNETKTIRTKQQGKRKLMKSHMKVESQYVAGVTPLMNCTCLARDTRSRTRNTAKLETRKEKLKRRLNAMLKPATQQKQNILKSDVKLDHVSQ